MGRTKMPKILDAETRLTHFVNGCNVDSLITKHYKKSFDALEAFADEGISDNWSSRYRFAVTGKWGDYAREGFYRWYNGDISTEEGLQGILDDLCKQKVIPRGLYVIEYNY